VSTDTQNAVANASATLENIASINSATRGNIVYIIADLSSDADESAINALKANALMVRVIK
ncbi:MAG: hypothetical protein K2K24_00735, partial [Clostridia bacterium]|nr:hypothetical protein [Clostridia bacterium]